MVQTFMVIDEVSPYNGILGRPWIGKINTITSATHQKIRYPIPEGVSSGRFLGYLVTQRGIEAHPNQIKAILNMKSPATIKEIPVTGTAAALNRFLSRSTDKCRPFFKALKKGYKDKWDDKCEVAFQNLKTDLTSPPLLSKSIPGEDLYIYLTVFDSAVSSALI
ncbi:unnamed protein product [Prunus brigantina]